LPLVLGQRSAPAAAAEPLLARYWAPQPQFSLGLALRGLASAALDISDGLLADCGHIAAASAVALRIEQSRVPLSDNLRAFLDGPAALHAALCGGDDYVLAFTLPPAHEQRLREAGQVFHVIGKAVAGTGVQLLDAQGHDITPRQRGYQHFQEQP
jgi:thiamine-monophosphate kinase